MWEKQYLWAYGIWKKKFKCLYNEILTPNLGNDQVFRAVKKKKKKKTVKCAFMVVHVMWSRSIDFEYDINLYFFYMYYKIDGLTIYHTNIANTGTGDADERYILFILYDVTSYDS